MSFPTRTTALAAALCTFACGAFAETISITFDNLAPGVTSPVVVTEVKGFKVAGAYAYDLQLLTNIKTFYDDIESDFPRLTTGGFLLNKDGSSSTSKTSRIVFSIQDILPSLTTPSGTSYAGQFISSLTYIAWGLGAIGVDGCSATCSDTGKTSSGSTGQWPAVPVERTFTDTQVTQVEFFAENDALFGLREINITLTPSVPGNDVPEPGSYALVGLALLAAGTARRRRA